MVYADLYRLGATGMTHDELLAEITSESADIGGAVIKALRAVVELHKPQEMTLPDGSWGQNCNECDNNWGTCSTIQAIEKALS